MKEYKAHKRSNTNKAEHKLQNRKIRKRDP